MDLKQIVLSEISFREFAQWKEKWDKVKPEMDCVFYAGIQNPLVYSCHEEAIYDFFKHEDAQGISVFDKAMPEGSKWRRLFKKELNKFNIEKLTGIYAAAARAQTKKRVFEMKFGSGYHSHELLILSFSAFDDGKVVSTCLEAPPRMKDKVTIKNNEELKPYCDRINAVWMPEA